MNKDKVTGIEVMLYEHMITVGAIGKGFEITAKSLRSFGKGPEIRKMVHSLRCAGFPICSNNNGYYVAKNSRELKYTINFLNSYIKNITKARDGLLETYHKFEDK
jgi:hypothetical protein